MNDSDAVSEILQFQYKAVASFTIFRLLPPRVPVTTP